MKQHQHFLSFKRLMLLFLCVLCVMGSVPGQAADGLDGLRDALAGMASLDGQLALLYEASVAHAEEFETGGWQVELNVEAAGGQEWIPAEEAYDAAKKADSLPEQFKNKRLIALYDDNDDDEKKVRLAGDLYVRLPEPMRARSVEEAEGVLILRHYLTRRSDYIGSAFNRHYALYARLFDSDTLYQLYHDTITPPSSGFGTLVGYSMSPSLLWAGIQPLFLNRILTVETAEGPLYFNVTGRGCTLYKVEGDREVLDIPAEAEGYPVTDITLRNLAKACPSLQEVHLPEGLVSIGGRTFAGCERLRTVNFPSTLRAIGDEAFDGVPLEELSLNEGLETIGEDAFPGGDVLHSVTLPSTLKAYSYGFLERGAHIPYLILPEGVERLGSYFLYIAPNMLCVYIPQTVTYFGDCLLNSGNLRIYTPEGSPAAEWAKKKGYGYTPCPSPEAMPRPAYTAEGDFEYGVLEGEAILMRYLGSGGEVTVPAELGGCPVKRIREYAFSSLKNLQSITLPACLAEIESMAILCDGVHVYIPGAETALTSPLSIHSHDSVVHAPEGSPAHQWCLKREVEWVAWPPER